MTGQAIETKDTITMLERLVAFNTVSAKSNLDLIGYVGDYLKGFGVESRLTFNAEKTKANLWATIGPLDKGGVVLSGHTDVVPVEDQEWSSDPFKLEERDGNLYGRGSADMKGFVAAALARVPDLVKRDLKTPIHLAFSYDEEVGCVGVKGLIDDMAENLPTPLAVIVGEPTMMKIIGGNKGGRGFNTEVFGVDGHSSLPEKGANAIMAAARIVNFLQDMQQRLKDNGDPDNGFDPYYTTIDLGTISGGTAHNVIPAYCKFGWGFRMVPSDDLDALDAEVMKFIDEEIIPPLKAVSPDAGVITTRRMDVPPLMPDETSAAETLIRHLTGLNESGRVSYGTEAGHFQNAGVPGVIFGPGDIKQAHLPDEFVAVEQMNSCNDFLGKLSDWAEKTG